MISSITSGLARIFFLHYPFYMSLDLSKYTIENGVVSLPLEDVKQLLIYVEEARQAKDRITDLETQLDTLQFAMGPEPAASELPEKIQKQIAGGSSPLRAIRKWRGLSQKALSKKTKISPSMLSEIETGVKTGSLESLKKLAQALDVNLDDLV